MSQLTSVWIYRLFIDTYNTSKLLSRKTNYIHEISVKLLFKFRVPVFSKRVIDLQSITYKELN